MFIKKINKKNRKKLIFMVLFGFLLTSSISGSVVAIILTTKDSDVKRSSPQNSQKNDDKQKLVNTSVTTPIILHGSDWLLTSNGQNAQANDVEWNTNLASSWFHTSDQSVTVVKANTTETEPKNDATVTFDVTLQIHMTTLTIRVPVAYYALNNSEQEEVAISQIVFEPRTDIVVDEKSYMSFNNSNNLPVESIHDINYRNTYAQVKSVKPVLLIPPTVDGTINYEVNANVRIAGSFGNGAMHNIMRIIALPYHSVLAAIAINATSTFNDKNWDKLDAKAFAISFGAFGSVLGATITSVTPPTHKPQGPTANYSVTVQYGVSTKTFSIDVMRA